MIRRTKNARSAILLAAMVAAAPAMAQAPQASPVAQEKAAGPAKKGPENGEKSKADKHGDKGEKDEKRHDKDDDKGRKDDDRKNDQGAKTDDKGSDPNTVGAAMRRGPESMPKERLERWKNQQDLERTKIKAALRGRAMNEAMKQELERHARRLARLERIKALATEAKDTATLERVNKLIEMENARHDRFTSQFDDKGAKDDRGPKEDKGAKDDKGPKDDKGSKEDKGGAK